jgi:hypothetical protein
LNPVAILPSQFSL